MVDHKGRLGNLIPAPSPAAKPGRKEKKMKVMEKAKICREEGIGRQLMRDVRKESRSCRMCPAYRCAIIGRNTRARKER
jgi:hypothetical protein